MGNGLKSQKLDSFFKPVIKPNILPVPIVKDKDKIDLDLGLGLGLLPLPVVSDEAVAQSIGLQSSSTSTSDSASTNHTNAYKKKVYFQTFRSELKQLLATIKHSQTRFYTVPSKQLQSHLLHGHLKTNRKKIFKPGDENELREGFPRHLNRPYQVNRRNRSVSESYDLRQSRPSAQQQPPKRVRRLSGGPTPGSGRIRVDSFGPARHRAVSFSERTHSKSHPTPKENQGNKHKASCEPGSSKSNQTLGGKEAKASNGEPSLRQNPKKKDVQGSKKEKQSNKKDLPINKKEMPNTTKKPSPPVVSNESQVIQSSVGTSPKEVKELKHNQAESCTSVT